MKSVSIALCTFNGAPFLKEQLESLLLQDYPIYEIIACDDCSTDSTQEILLGYKNKYPDKISLFFNTENLGYRKNFEKAISLCSGTYIALSDQDDIWEKNKISTLLLEISNADAIHSDAILIDEIGTIISESYTRTVHKPVYSENFIDLVINNAVTGCTLLFKKKLLGNLFCFPSVIAHDHWIALLAFSKKSLKYYNKPLVRYRQHSGNVLGAFDKNSSSKKRTRAELYTDRIIKLLTLKKAMNGFFPFFYIHKIEKLINYYDSYFIKKIRFSAFIFHIQNINAFSREKSLLSSIKSLIFSLFGSLKK